VTLVSTKTTPGSLASWTDALDLEDTVDMTDAKLKAKEESAFEASF